MTIHLKHLDAFKIDFFFKIISGIDIFGLKNAATNICENMKC